MRIGIHTGEGRLGGSEYVGIDVHRELPGSESAVTGARRCSRRPPPASPNTRFRRREHCQPGNHRLKDLTHEEHLYQLTVEGLQTEFPPCAPCRAHRGTCPDAISS